MIVIPNDALGLASCLPENLKVSGHRWIAGPASLIDKLCNVWCTTVHSQVERVQAANNLAVKIIFIVCHIDPAKALAQASSTKENA